MRILIYSYNYYPEPIGIAPLMTELAEGLVSRGHEVRVVTAMPNYPERRIYPAYRDKLYVTEERNGVRIQRCYVAIWPKPGLLARMALEGSFITLSFFKALCGWRPDIILSTSPSLPACLPVAILKMLYGCPVILNLQDILPEAAIQTGLLTNKLAIRVFKFLEQFAYCSCDRISVIAESFRENLLAKGVSPRKINFIPNWVDTEFIRPVPKRINPFRQAHQLENKFVVLYSGNIARTQGVHTIIDAAKQLEQFSQIAFVIVGEASQLADLENHRQLLQANNVTLLPFEPREKLPQMLGAADVGLIMQKRNVVGFNMPSKTQVLLASGRPIVASVPHNGTAARAIRDSGGGIVVDPENPSALAGAVLYLYQHPQVMQDLGVRGRAYAEKYYAFDKALDRYEHLFKQLAHRTEISSTSQINPDDFTSSRVSVSLPVPLNKHRL